MNYAPVVMFVYNRTDHFIKTYEALSKCPESKFTNLFIFSDGAKNPENEGKVKEVRDTIRQIMKNTNFKEIILKEASENKGLARSVISGVTDIINQYSKVIVVEDDCVPSPYFLKYMNLALAYYKDDRCVGSIAGYAPPIKLPEYYKSDIYATCRSCSWGWATWSEVWNNVDWDLKYISKFYHEPKLIKKINSYGNDRFLRLYRQTISNANSWSVKFGAHHIKEDLITIYPRYSYISNIGCDESGVHSKAEDAEKMRVDLSKSIAEPKFEHVTVNKDIQKLFKKHYSAGWVSDIKRYLATQFIIMKEKKKTGDSNV